MKIFKGERGSGKTTKAIEVAYLTNSILLVHSKIIVPDVQAKADYFLKETYGAPSGSIKVVWVMDYLNRSPGLRYEQTGVVIDELDIVLRQIFAQKAVPSNVVFSTVTSDSPIKVMWFENP